MTSEQPGPKYFVSQTAESLIRTYLGAKDDNRPHLIARSFAPDASLRMSVKSDAITFPAQTDGQAAIADVLVRRFGQTYENVYTFCLDTPPSDDTADRYVCDWLVGMTDKATGSVRVGCGSYVWTFTGTGQALRVKSLEITIEAMEVLAAEHADAVLDDWLGTLPYPWCDRSAAQQAAPSLPELAPVLACLEK